MIEKTFTAALYLFSSLLQADATILGFGAIIIIYKIQSLDNRYKLAWELCVIKPYERVQEASKLIRATKTEEIVEVLKKNKNNELYSQLELLITIPKRMDEIKSMIKYPLIAIGAHAVICSLFISFTSSMDYKSDCIQWVSYIIILFFGIIIFWTIHITWVLVTNKDELSLSKIDKELYSRLNS